jgi:RNA polymerase sigma-70 factor (ECF subfamily)
MNANRERDGALFASAIPLQTHLRNRARYLAKASADADDLVQDTFERALRASTKPSDPVDLQRWLARVLTNLWIDQSRSRKVWRSCHRKLAASEVVTGDEAPEPARWGTLSIAEVRAALADVPEPYRSAYQQHVLERRSYLVVARHAGIRPNTVGTRVLRARQYLRQILEERFCQDGHCAADDRRAPSANKNNQTVEETAE